MTNKKEEYVKYKKAMHLRKIETVKKLENLEENAKQRGKKKKYSMFS